MRASPFEMNETSLMWSTAEPHSDISSPLTQTHAPRRGERGGFQNGRTNSLFGPSRFSLAPLSLHRTADGSRGRGGVTQAAVQRRRAQHGAAAVPPA